MRKLGCLAVGLVMLSSTAVHAASLDGIVVSISQDSGFGYSDFSPCRSLSSTAAIGAAVELLGSPAGDECVGYFDVDIDAATQRLTLTGRENGNYEVGRLVISGLTPYGLVSVTTLSNNLFDPLYFEGFATATPAPSISFDADSITISFSAEGLGDGQFNYGNGDAYTAVFQLSASAVPEPQTWALMAFGLAAIGAAARRRA